MVDDGIVVSEWQVYLGQELRFTVGHGPRRVPSGYEWDRPGWWWTSTSFIMADLFGGELLLPDGEPLVAA